MEYDDCLKFEDDDCDLVPYLSEDGTSLHIDRAFNVQDAFDYIEKYGYDISQWTFIECERTGEHSRRTIFHRD